MRIEDVTENDDINRCSPLSTLRLPLLSSPTSLTGPQFQSDAMKKIDEANPDADISEENSESQSPKKVKPVKSLKKASNQWRRKIEAPRYLPKTAERLSIVQRTYGVTVVPERVLFRSLRPQVQSKTRKILSQLEKCSLKKREEKANSEESILTAAQDVRTIEVDVPFVWDEKKTKEAALASGSLSLNESSVSLPNSSDDNKNAMPFSFPSQKKKRFTKTRKKEKKEDKEEVAKQEAENLQSSAKQRPKFRRRKKSSRADKEITDFFLKLTKKPPMKPIIDPRFKDQERLLVDYYKRCQDFLLAEPKAGAVSNYCSNVNNSSKVFKKRSDQKSYANLNDADIEKEEAGNAISENNLDSSEILQNPSLNSLEDFDAFVAKTVMQKISKSKRRRARVKSLLKREYAKNHNDVLHSSSNEEENYNNNLNGTLGEHPNLGHTVDDDANNILSSCSSNEFSNFSDSPEPIMNSIDKFDSFVAKTIKNHIYRQASLRRIKKPQKGATKMFNSYDTWLRRRIFGYRRRRKMRQNSNVSNSQSKKHSSKTMKSKMKQNTYTTTCTDSLFSDDDVKKPSKKRPIAKKRLIEDVVKAMQNIDNELMVAKHGKDKINREDSDTATSQAGFSSQRSSFKMNVQRTESLPLLNELQEKRAEALTLGIENALTAPKIHRANQIASAIQFTMPRKVFHFADTDKCHKFEKMVRKYTGQDHVLLNSIKAMNDINMRLLTFHKRATDKHKEKLRRLERKRREILIREGLMDRDFDDLEVKREKQFLRRFYNPKRVVRNFTGNPMRGRYNMASKTFKVQDELNVAESYGKLQSRKRLRGEKKKKKFLGESEYIPRLQSESSEKKTIIDVTGEKMTDYYNSAKNAFDSLFAPDKILGYRSQNSHQFAQSLSTLSSESFISDIYPSSKSSRSIFEKFTREESKRREKKLRKEKEKAKKKLLEKRAEEKSSASEITNVTSLSTSADKDIVHIRVAAGAPPHQSTSAKDKLEKAEQDPVEEEAPPTVTINRTLSDYTMSHDSADKTVVGLTKMITEMMDKMDEEHDFDLVSGRKKRPSRKSSKISSSLKTREATTQDVLMPIPEAKRMSRTRTVSIKKNRVRSMRTGMQLSSSQPAPLLSTIHSEAHGETTPIPTAISSKKNGKEVSTHERTRTSSKLGSRLDSRSNDFSHTRWGNFDHYRDTSIVLQKSAVETPQFSDKEIPTTQPVSKDEFSPEREFSDSRIFFEQGLKAKPKKKQKKKP